MGSRINVRVSNRPWPPTLTPLYQIDVLLRPGPQATPPSGDPGAVKTDVMRIIANAATSPNGLSQADRAYLAQVEAQRTGLPPQEAEARVTQVVNQATRFAKDTADRARKTAMATGFLTAARLILSLGAAWWAAQRGGQHRDTARRRAFTNSAVRGNSCSKSNMAPTFCKRAGFLDSKSLIELVDENPKCSSFRAYYRYGVCACPGCRRFWIVGRRRAVPEGPGFVHAHDASRIQGRCEKK